MEYEGYVIEGVDEEIERQSRLVEVTYETEDDIPPFPRESLVSVTTGPSTQSMYSAVFEIRASPFGLPLEDAVEVAPKQDTAMDISVAGLNQLLGLNSHAPPQAIVQAALVYQPPPPAPAPFSFDLSALSALSALTANVGAPSTHSPASPMPQQFYAPQPPLQDQHYPSYPSYDTNGWQEPSSRLQTAASGWDTIAGGRAPLPDPPFQSQNSRNQMTRNPRKNNSRHSDIAPEVPGRSKGYNVAGPNARQCRFESTNG